MSCMKAKDLDKLFDDGEEDVLQYFDVSKTRRINWEHELVELDLPKERLAELDAEAARLNTTRSQLISKWVRERLEKASTAAE
ncbi:MAG: CopG family transcriptional regulator [Alphaproteobacteria bacterium]|nr:CopG family transcriptional regulator [Alphaproteobacteria bacterium]MBU1550375.1 CopG family transcriptional regulator [Alphaproteobacteria bacterium]MBU2338511.1 CopG family transcriptional regulator [Alphaproteobacteria bacterium]MBU2389151.1 CopG family transcriptional regulator [Alphaproteobacteria bacterium]